ncbi:MAG: hypothetical protein KAS49_08230, partial [Candidatus Cloacimonetes bacterium]|nr:hypothetical protein [Candidatus Cloacimonadota bacterium]
MKKISILILIIIVSSLSAIVITPEFPTVYDGNSDFVLRVQDGFNDTEVARMLYREAGEQVFNEIEMGKGSASNPIYEARIPNKKEFLSGIEFYFEIDLKDGAKLTSPELNPQVNPYRIAVKKEESISEGFVLIAPDTAFPLKSDKLLIAISYFAIQDIIIPSSIRFIFNGMDVTSKANISKNMVVLDVDAPKKGKHNFKLEASTIEGNKISSKMWSTNVSAPKLELPLNLSGNISLYGILNAEKDNAAERDANVRLRLQGRKNWFSFKSKLYISSLESSKEQTVNRYRLDLNVPHLRMKFGDYSPDLGAFSHNSVNVRGIFTELDFTKFSMKVLYGNSKRAIKGNLITKVDSLGEVTGYSNNDIEFERRSMALRTEFGHRRYFRFGLNIIKNKDIVESLDESAYMAPDSTLLVKPKDNIVLSTDTKFAFMDQRIIFGAEAAMSLYNSNILDGPITKDSLESIAGSEVPIDPADFEDIFVLSSTIEPFIPSLANLAYKAYFRMFVFHNLINVSYSVVGESFYNLGVGYLGKDMSTLSINDNLSLINNRLLINLAYNINSNNILDNKEFTTSNNGMFAQIYAKPT